MKTIIITVCLCLAWLVGEPLIVHSKRSDRSLKIDKESGEHIRSGQGRLLPTATDLDDSVFEWDHDRDYEEDDSNFEKSRTKPPEAPAEGMDQEDSSDASESDDNDELSDDTRLLPRLNNFTTRARCNGPSCNFRSKCGLAPLNSLSRNVGGLSNDPFIVNGVQQRYGEWPSYVKIVISSWSSSALCGGVLVSDQHVMTAAHCVFGITPWVPGKVDPRNIKITLGEHSIRLRDPQERTYDVISVCSSRRFRPPSNQNNGNVQYDFAVLTLKTRVVFNNHHQPACLPYDQLDPARAQCYLPGLGAYGFVGERPLQPDVVIKIRVRPVSCARYGFGYRDISRECYTKYDGPGDSCSGDSGGPVLCLDPRTKRWTVGGFGFIWSKYCNGKDAVGWTGAYTRVTTLLPTIKQECGI